RPTRPAPPCSSRLRHVLHALVRPRALGAAHLARRLVRHRPRGRRDAPSGVRYYSVDTVRRSRLARDLLHNWAGALADERDQYRVGAHTPWYATQRAAWDVLKKAGERQRMR